MSHNTSFISTMLSARRVEVLQIAVENKTSCPSLVRGDNAKNISFINVMSFIHTVLL
jgi:hypothetical protein